MGKTDIGAVRHFLEQTFPEMFVDGDIYEFEPITEKGARLSLSPLARHLRPGGTISGPTLMTLADLVAYVAVLGHKGLHALAVTTNLSINFLRRSPPGRLFAEAEIIKNGKALVVLDVRIYGEREGENAPPLVAQANLTYAMPPDARR